MASHTITVQAERIMGRFYPVGSDTPVPSEAVISTEKDHLDGLQSRSNLKVGDVVLDALGRPYVVNTARDPFFFEAEVLVAFRPDSTSFGSTELSQLTAPITLLAREGDRVQDTVMFR